MTTSNTACTFRPATDPKQPQLFPSTGVVNDYELILP
jgi:hypothetical protein